MHVEFSSVYDHKPFIFLLDMAELIPSPLQLHLQAFDANHSLQQVLVKICILLLQRPEHRGMLGDGVLSQNIDYLEVAFLHPDQYFQMFAVFIYYINIQ